MRKYHFCVAKISLREKRNTICHQANIIAKGLDFSALVKSESEKYKPILDNFSLFILLFSLPIQDVVENWFGGPVVTTPELQPQISSSYSILYYVFINGIAGIVTNRFKLPKPLSPKHHLVFGANGRFTKRQ